VDGGDPGTIPGLSVCGGGEAELELDAAKPLVLFVPGHGDRGDRYAELAWRFERQGMQAACFAYNDRADLEASSARLIRALEALEARLAPGRITVVAHSQGGLIARRALVGERPDRLRTVPGFTYTLVAVATPFGGVRATADCGRTWLHILTLGTSAAVCSIVSGDAWKDLPPSSVFIRNPGTLVPEVTEAIGVVTQERGTCRRRTFVGVCDESDAVFSVGEQRNATIEGDSRWARVEVAAGHDEIVGAVGTPPLKLFTVLESQGILTPQPTPARVARP
jgi:pimeloyl-ACP methyl ester carboxylesterase